MLRLVWSGRAWSFDRLYKLETSKYLAVNSRSKVLSAIIHSDESSRKANKVEENKVKSYNIKEKETARPHFLKYAAAATVVGESTTPKETIDLSTIPDLPEPPAIPEVLSELSGNLEPTFASLGLGGYTPVGFFERALEILHVDVGLPWWGAIALCTVVVRALISPLVIMSQRNAAKMNNHMPELQLLQMKMSEARQSGNALESARYAQEVMMFMKEKKLNPLKNMLVPLAQAPLFISFFMGLRNMAGKPVESMVDGGLFWFADLTIPDPTYLLPLITSATLYITIEIGTDSARLNSSNMGLMKYVLRLLPVIIFPFTMNFPAAILTYWTCTNLISLGQVSILRIPAVRKYFQIDALIHHKPESLPIKKKNFVEGVKDSWQNIKITRELEERHRLNEMRFAKAGKGPLIKTYKHDPTKPQPTKPLSSPGRTMFPTKKNF